jgi:thiol-disulfide isomerase/thioredoxin
MNSPENPPQETLAPSPPSGAPPLGKQARIAVAVLAVCALAALFWPRGDGTFKEPGGFLYDSQGRATTLGPQLRPVSLVHFWATWCPPCLAEIPALQRLEKDFAGDPQFDIVMVAVQDSKDKVDGMMGTAADMVLYDPKWDVAKRYGTDKLPETYLVVRGQVVEKFVGQQDWDDPEVRRKVRAHLSAAQETNQGGTPAAGS